MSSPWAADLVAALGSAYSNPVALAEIVFSEPAALTLRVATREVILPDGTLWEAGLACEPVQDEVGYLEPGPSPVVFAFSLAHRRYAALAATPGAHAAAYRWKGAAVTLYLWDCGRHPDGTALLASASSKGRVVAGYVDTHEATLTGFAVTAMQGRQWNADFPPHAIDATSDPTAPEGAIGAAKPVIYGAHTSPPLRGASAGLGFESDFENVGGARGVVPLIVTDPGAGAAKVRLLAADHALADLYGTADATRLYMAGADRWLCPLDTSAGFTETLGAGGSYADIDDDLLAVFYPIVPVDVKTGGGYNTADNPRRAFSHDETLYATLDQNAGKGKLSLYLPSPARFGKINSVTIVACVSGDPANTHNLRIAGQDTTTGANSTLYSGASTSATPSLISGTYDTTFWNQNWAFGVNDGGLGYGGTAGNTLALYVEFAGGTTNRGRVYWVALYANVKPTRNTLVPATPAVRGWRPPSNRFGGARDVFGAFRIGTVRPGEPEKFAVDSTFYAHLKGYADDGSGTFTGSAGALLERAPDILRHLLVTYGGIAGASTETGAGVHGSFVDARDIMRGDGADDYKLAAYFGTRDKLQRAAQAVCEQSLSTFWEDPFDGKWRMVPWRIGATATYPRRIAWADVWDIKLGEDSIVDVRTEVRVGYLFDHYRGKTLFEAFVSPDGSSRGYNEPTYRDQRLVVTAGVNDDLDWKTGAWGGGPFTFADVLTAGTYASPIDLAAEVQAKLRTHVVAYYMHAGHGFTIKAGYNDSCEFGYGAGAYAVLLQPGEYTADGLCVELARAMNAAAGTDRVITWTYSRSTNKFTAASSGSNISITAPVVAASPGSLCWPVVGLFNGAAAAASITGTHARYGETFWAGSESTATFQFLFGSGASAATSCAQLMGWPAADTALGNNTSATYARGVREAECVTLKASNRVADADRISADMIRDEATAVALRNRRFDLTTRPPAPLTFSTYRMGDVRRCETFEMDPDLDEHVPFTRYGSDGSWSGKVFMCLARVQHMGPLFHQTIRAVEVRPAR